MSGQTSIEWTDRTWNPLTGCTKVSPGCDNCYAKTMHERFNGPGSFDTITLHPERLRQPSSWRKPSRVFVNSMSDLFHKDSPDEFIARVWAAMAAEPRHTFQVLTKRPGRMRSFLSKHWPDPLPNVWGGTSVEDQHWAGVRIPLLQATPLAVRFLSCEPLLGPVDLGGWAVSPDDGTTVGLPLDWVIVGGESGPGARPMHPDWARSLRDQCVAAGVPFLFKQWGEWAPESMWLHRDNAPASFLATDGTVRPLVNGKPAYPPMARSEDITIRRVGKKRAGRELDGRTWDEYPAGAS